MSTCYGIQYSRFYFLRLGLEYRGYAYAGWEYWYSGRHRLGQRYNCSMERNLGTCENSTAYITHLLSPVEYSSPFYFPVPSQPSVVYLMLDHYLLNQ